MKTDYDLRIESMKESRFYTELVDSDSSLDRASLKSGYEDGYFNGCKKGYHDNDCLDYAADTPEDAINLAYNNYKKDVDYYKNNYKKHWNI